jgi:hypothetical protein
MGRIFNYSGGTNNDDNTFVLIIFVLLTVVEVTGSLFLSGSIYQMERCAVASRQPGTELIRNYGTISAITDACPLRDIDCTRVPLFFLPPFRPSERERLIKSNAVRREHRARALARTLDRRSAIRGVRAIMQKCQIIVNHERYSGVLKTRYFARSSKWFGDSISSSVLIKARRVRFRDRYGKQIDIRSCRVESKLG